MTICSCIFWTGLNLLHWDLLCFAPSWARMLCKLFGVLFWVSSSGRLGEGLTPQWILSILRLLNYCFGASSVWTDCNAEHLRCYHQGQCHEVQIHHDDLLHRLKENVCHRHGMLVHHCQTDFWTVWVTFSLAKATGFESPESVVMNSLSYFPLSQSHRIWIPRKWLSSVYPISFDQTWSWYIVATNVIGRV